MRIRLTKAYKHHRAGQVLDLDDRTARALIAIELAAEHVQVVSDTKPVFEPLPPADNAMKVSRPIKAAKKAAAE